MIDDLYRLLETIDPASTQTNTMTWEDMGKQVQEYPELPSQEEMNAWFSSETS